MERNLEECSIDSLGEREEQSFSLAIAHHHHYHYRHHYYHHHLSMFSFSVPCSHAAAALLPPVAK